MSYTEGAISSVHSWVQSPWLQFCSLVHGNQGSCWFLCALTGSFSAALSRNGQGSRTQWGGARGAMVSTAAQEQWDSSCLSSARSPSRVVLLRVSRLSLSQDRLLWPCSWEGSRAMAAAPSSWCGCAGWSEGQALCWAQFLLWMWTRNSSPDTQGTGSLVKSALRCRCQLPDKKVHARPASNSSDQKAFVAQSCQHWGTQMQSCVCLDLYSWWAGTLLFSNLLLLSSS